MWYFELFTLIYNISINRYFFKVSDSPMRELCYITQSVGLFAMVPVVFAIDFLFFGMCLYIAAMYKNLRDTLTSIDRKSNNSLTHNEKIHDNQRSLRNYIEFHLAIIRYIFYPTINSVHVNNLNENDGKKRFFLLLIFNMFRCVDKHQTQFITIYGVSEFFFCPHGYTILSHIYSFYS